MSTPCKHSQRLCCAGALGSPESIRAADSRGIHGIPLRPAQVQNHIAKLVVPHKVTPQLNMTQWILLEKKRSCVSANTQWGMELGMQMVPRSQGKSKIYYVAKDGLEFLLLLLLLPVCWDDRNEPPYSAHINEHFNS